MNMTCYRNENKIKQIVYYLYLFGKWEQKRDTQRITCIPDPLYSHPIVILVTLFV